MQKAFHCHEVIMVFVDEFKHVDGLAQDSGNSIANALELP